MKQHSIFHKVYDLVQKVPKGKVTTYGAIAQRLSISPRVVGYALHANPDGSLIPCHRVVNREGRLAPGFAFGGNEKQRELLEKEGVMFKDDLHVNLTKYNFNF